MKGTHKPSAIENQWFQNPNGKELPLSADHIGPQFQVPCRRPALHQRYNS